MNELYKKRINFLVTNSQTKKKVHGHHKKNEEKVQKKSELKNLSYDKTKSEKQLESPLSSIFHQKAFILQEKFIK